MEDQQKQKDEKNSPPTPPTGEAGPPLKKEEGVETLATELEACKKQAEEYLNGWKRAKADYINLKKENEAAGAELAQFVAAGILIKILPVYGGLKRACQKMPLTRSGNNGSTGLATGLSPERAEESRAIGRSASGGEGWAEGILNIKKQFEEVFKSFGVAEIKTVGEKFNPEFHEAVSRQKKDGVESDTVIEEVSGGYTMHGKVILAAKVIVSE